MLRKPLCVLTLSVLAAACVFATGQAEEPPTAPVKLMGSENALQDALDGIVDRFTDETGIEVDYEKVPGGSREFGEKVDTMLAAREFPDLIINPLLLSTRYARLGISMDLTDQLSEEITDDYTESALATVTYEDRIHGFPFFLDAITLYYNPALLEASGVAAPASVEDAWSWDEFTEVVQTVKRANDLDHGLAIGDDLSLVLPILYQGRATVLNEDQTAAGIDSPQARDAISWFKSWFDRDLAPLEAYLGVEEADGLFGRGQVGFLWYWSGSLPRLLTDFSEVELRATYLPTGQVHGNKLGGWNLSVIDQAPRPDEAIELGDWITSTSNMVAFCSSTGQLPTKLSAQQSVEFGELQPFADVFMAEIATLPAFAVRDHAVPEYRGYKRLVAAAIERILVNDDPADRVLAGLAEEIDRTLFEE
jgi:multiple sugar transport system substrate-binding protein